MSEHIDISVKGVPNFGAVEAKLKKIGDLAKKTKIGGGGSNKPPNSPPNKPPTKPNPTPASKISPTTNAIYQAKDRGAVAASMMSSDLDETSRGGFYNTLNSKVNMFKGAFGNNKNTETQGQGNESSIQPASKSSNNKPNEINGAIFKNSKFEGRDGNGNGKGNGSGILPSSNNGNGIDTNGDGGKGSIISKVAGAIPVLGGVIAAATAGVLKIVSDVGQKHVQAIESQIGTIGATGSYVGGGGGYFDNSQVASAKVSSGRINGENIRNGGNPIDNQEMRFAYNQGRGLSEVVDAMAQLKKQNGSSVNFYRGAANASGFNNLRESEFLTKLGSMSESLRSKGYSGDMQSFSESVAGTKIGGFGDPARKMSVAESIGDKSRSGVFGGGVVGGLAMAEAMKETDNDFLGAMKLLEGKDGHKYGMKALSGFDSLTKGVLFKQQGIGSVTEGSEYSFDPNKIVSAASALNDTGQMVTEQKNKSLETFSGDTGKEAAKLAFDMQNSLLEMFKTLQPTLNQLIPAISNIENAGLKGLSSAVQSMEPTLTKLAGGDWKGALKEVISAALSASPVPMPFSP